MKTVQFDPEDYETLRTIMEADIEDIANDISFFEELKIDPKTYIDQRISISEKLEMNFWDVVNSNCGEFQAKRLKALYAGISLKEFTETYEIPS